MSTAGTLQGVVSIVGGGASFASGALPWIKLFTGLVPGASSVMAGLEIAGPILEKIAAGAPIVIKLIEQGRPIIGAIEAAGPSMLPNIKKLIAVLDNADPSKPEITHKTAGDVSNAEAIAFAGPVVHGLLGRAWTSAEEQAWFARTGGNAADR